MFELKMHTSLRDYKTTPVAAFYHLYHDEQYAFLYESLEQGGIHGRFSFLGSFPKIIFRSKNSITNISIDNYEVKQYGNPFMHLRKLLKPEEKSCYFAPFSGGAVGYVTYDAIRYFEKIPDKNPDELEIPDLLFIFPLEIIIYDHQYKLAHILMFYNDHNRLNYIKEILKKGFSFKQKRLLRKRKIFCNSNFTKKEFCNVIKKAKEYISAGDIFQVVLSQRFKTAVDMPHFDIYQALRLTNPSPYMYYLKLDNITILGSSPETLVKLKNGIAISRPLAGTRPRGRNRAEDKRLERELLNDEKEIAEHIMLVDLARNDLGKVCQYGTVKTTVLLDIERYSKVMHIVSNVVGRLSKDFDGIDLFVASFPAGTVSGAPKIRAMEIIDELENVKRGLYAGAIGYFDSMGNIDFCIGIRMILIKDGIAYIQGGAGIVADSIPEKEYQETINKTNALKLALEIA
ncbi:MAG: anthranilate synthase component I [candidate division WOR-3 bacterium]|nr:anthranilate synthase component I [candidate division WOR-3 bacterium]